MLILTVVLVGGGFWLVTGWVIDELAESRRDRAPKPRKHVHRRPPVWARLLDAYLAGAREMAHASALMRGVLP